VASTPLRAPPQLFASAPTRLISLGLLALDRASLLGLACAGPFLAGAGVVTRPTHPVRRWRYPLDSRAIGGRVAASALLARGLSASAGPLLRAFPEAGP